MKTLYNPTDSVVAMKFLGNTYEIAPMGELNVAEEVATHWVTKVHEFLQVKEYQVKSKIKEVEKSLEASASTK